MGSGTSGAGPTDRLSKNIAQGARYTLQEVIRADKNVFCVGFAMDALNRLANLGFQEEEAVGLMGDLQTNLLTILGTSPLRSWESLVRSSLSSEVLSEFDRLGPKSFPKNRMPPTR